MNGLFSTTFALLSILCQSVFGCPEGGGWVALGDSCYLHSLEHFGWENAQIVRKNLGNCIVIYICIVLVLYGERRILG